MKRTTLRVSAATAMAAVTFGIAAPAASAGEEHHAKAPVVAAAPAKSALSAAEAEALLATPAVRAELTPEARAELRAVADGTATEAQAKGAASSAAKAFWKLVKKAGPKVVKAAKKAARKYSTFRNWVNDLKWYNPIKLAWMAAGQEAQYRIWKFVHSQTG
ncbi:hypothetical protein [Streptomyces spectabilis]|uniref:Lytic transglycosylase domain-containing protein n=1 Tax=Streptomyces spectabilis TaxID=68270 RepID=A0A5P2WZJ2_STRST|nr:hypothetical protein [Streptomyces spectabilis]MBB5108832.1 hypothetical protein [Streptomyces spectabilis]MCI3899864.1 hypothetical protein [Streptomyces spectabilis]QEV57518.1 hypothetical protein CP982_01235 [Streptomyces spectabilis]GGV42402.1 hypothetical protein GCM10010245_66510 [Streptomyces spectabilis]